MTKEFSKRITFKYKYFLKIAALGKFPEIEITEADYNDIKTARQILSAALNLEEKYDVVIGNFLELEKELLAVTADRVLDIRFDYDRAYEISSLLNRRLVNFVMVAKSYTELLADKACKCIPSDSTLKASVKSLTNEHYDASFNYRYMEALRNHLAHSGLGVHQVENPDKWGRDDDGKATNLVLNTCIYSLKKNISENTGFHAKVFKEMPDKVDLKRAARSYLGRISALQDDVRKLVLLSVKSSRELIEVILQNTRLKITAHHSLWGRTAQKSMRREGNPLCFY